YEREKKSIKKFKDRLRPFLINEDASEKLDYFQSIINQLI
ncbi:MAG: hypothetical protein UR63_C0033G0012, partial [Candidatus Roizmanbacteria bacterium GW2011_GWC2_35_12]